MPRLIACAGHLLLGLLTILCSYARAGSDPEPIPFPPLAPIERGAYRAREMQSESELWRVDWVLQKHLENGRTLLRFQENGTGIREALVPSSWTVRMTIDLWGKDPRLTSVREARGRDGRPQQIEERDFSYASGTGQVKTMDVGTGQSDTHTVRIHAHAYTPEVLPAALRLLPGEKDQQMRFDLITRGGYSIGMHATVIGRERIEVPAGSFECYKIELDPTGFFGVIADLTMYRIFMWHTVAAPHFWVKYEGPLAGPGSRQIVRELVRFDIGAEGRR